MSSLVSNSLKGLGTTNEHNLVIQASPVLSVADKMLFKRMFSD